jgi:hypothetical protein
MFIQDLYTLFFPTLWGQVTSDPNDPLPGMQGYTDR